MLGERLVWLLSLLLYAVDALQKAGNCMVQWRHAERYMDVLQFRRGSPGIDYLTGRLEPLRQWCNILSRTGFVYFDCSEQCLERIGR